MRRLQKFLLVIALARCSFAAGRQTVYISGSVAMDDGSQLSAIAEIQTVCANVASTVGYTDQKGSFQFQWTRPGTTVITTDLADQSIPTSMDVAAVNCEISAKLPGFISTRLNLYAAIGQQSVEAGRIILHRADSAPQTTTVSALSFKAPAQAKKSFAKGARLMNENKVPAAVAEFSKAVQSYPDYVDAWIALGKAQWRLGANAGARASFARAMNLDNKASDPWRQLGFMASEEMNWNEAARDLDQAVRLDPEGSSASWYFDALANYKLGRISAAEQSVRTYIHSDQTGNARGPYLLGLVLIARNDSEGAMTSLRIALAAAPADSSQAKDAQRALSLLQARSAVSTASAQ